MIGGAVLAHHRCCSHRLRTNLPARPRAHASSDPLLTVGGSKSPHGWVRPGDPHILKRRRPEARRPEAPLPRRQVPRDPHASQGTGSEPGAALGSKATCGLRSPLGSVSPWAGEGAGHVPGAPRRGLTRGAPLPDGAGERWRQSRQCGKMPVSADGPGYVQMVWNPRRNVDKRARTAFTLTATAEMKLRRGLRPRPALPGVDPAQPVLQRPLVEWSPSSALHEWVISRSSLEFWQ